MEVRDFLQSKNEEELRELVAELAQRYLDVSRFLRERALLESGNANKLISSLRSEIRSITEGPVGGWDRWEGSVDMPDYSHVEEQFEQLARQGCFDALLDLGRELMERGSAQIEESDEECDLATPLGDCMEVVVEALPKSSLSKPEQLLWYIERDVADEFGILDHDRKEFLKANYSPDDWKGVAQLLEERAAAGDGGYGLVSWLLRANEECGEADRNIDVLVREKRYVQLVDTLLKAGRRDEAKERCLWGYGEALKSEHHSVETLHDRLRDMAEEEKRHDLAAAYRSDDFFDKPSEETYAALRQAAEKVKCWPAVRKAALHFLETGQCPDRRQKDMSWPLPPTEVAHLEAKYPRGKEKRVYKKDFPQREILLRVAMLEKRLDDVIALYRAWSKTPKDYFYRSSDYGYETRLDDRVAHVISGSHPDVALEIWRSLVDKLIAHTKPAAYEAAKPYLSSMKALYEKKNRRDEWPALISELRTTHKLKRSLLKVLAAIE
ncbi:MAG: hypothetical protein LBS00_10580 [Synergistaceae bacterium]|jgi:uncharacterized Zn finger protein|nr:hypothetical protein [Synergistaceae bacterium]